MSPKQNSSMEVENVFAELFEPQPLKTISVTLTILLVFCLMALNFGIIFYEKFGSDKKRTIINKLFSSTCWSVNAFYFFCQLTESFIYVYGPLPESVCFVHLINKRATVTQVSSCSISRVSKLGLGSHVARWLL